MKTSHVLALATSLASASAFVPSTPASAGYKRTRTSIASSPVDEVIEMPKTPEPESPKMPQTGPQYMKELPGSTPPVQFFDPLGISSKFRAIDVKKFRESEVKHGRVAMLAFTGMFLQEIAHPLFPAGGADLGPAIYHMQAVQKDFALAPLLLLAFVGVLEGQNIYVGWEKQPIREGVADLKQNFEPGNLGFDPFGLMPKDEAGRKTMMTKELNNGRLAMIATIGVWAQELVDGKTILGHLFG